MNNGENSNAVSDAHKVHGVVILGITLLFYVVFFGQFDSSDGGGQPTLPGMGKVVALFLIILALIVTIYQLLVFRTIRRSRRMSVANIMLALPPIGMISIGIGLLELPDLYQKSIFASLLVSVFIQYFALRRLNYLFAGIGYTLMGITLIVCIDWMGRSARSSRWWENGRVVKHYANGVKRSESERVVEGRSFGNFTQWNEAGIIEAFDRYPEGHSKPPDSTVRYHPDGSVASINYIFDSAGIGYKRRIGYTQSGMLRNLDEQTTTLDTQFQRSETYDHVTGELRNLDYNFDSAGERYRRALTFDDQGLRWMHLEGLRKSTKYVRKFPRRK